MRSSPAPTIRSGALGEVLAGYVSALEQLGDRPEPVGENQSFAVIVGSALVSFHRPLPAGRSAGSAGGAASLETLIAYFCGAAIASTQTAISGLFSMPIQLLPSAVPFCLISVKLVLLASQSPRIRILALPSLGDHKSPRAWYHMCSIRIRTLIWQSPAHDCSEFRNARRLPNSGFLA